MPVRLHRGGFESHTLTPRHLFRQLELSLFFNGQTTSLLASVTEKELVSELRGGMVYVDRVNPIRYKDKKRAQARGNLEHRTEQNQVKGEEEEKKWKRIIVVW